MKKFVLGFVFSVSCFQLFAQITYGLKGGIALSRYNYDIILETGVDYDKQKSSCVFLPVGSIVVDVPLSKTFSIRPEFGYRKQAYSYMTFESIFFFQYYTQEKIVKGTLNYLELPVNLAIKLPFGKRKMEALIGGTVGLCLGGKGGEVRYRIYDSTFVREEKRTSDRTFTAGEVPDGWQNSPEDYVNKFNFNLNAGLGYTFKNKIVLNGMFNYGLTPIFPQKGYNPPYENTIVRSMSCTFTVAYMLGGRKNSAIE